MEHGNERDIVTAFSHSAYMVQNAFQVMASDYQAPHIIEKPQFGIDGD